MAAFFVYSNALFDFLDSAKPLLLPTRVRWHMAFSADITVAAYATAGVATALIVGFSLPALTEADATTLAPAANVETTVLSETRYCETNLSGVNCVCFAGKSAQIMAHDAPRYPGAYHANQTELARTQARHSC